MPSQLVGIDRGNSGFYLAVAPDGSVEIDNSSSGGDAAPLVLVGDWIYVTGQNPRAASSSVVAGAEGSSLVLQRIAASGSAPSRTRVILLSGDSAWAHLANDPDTSAELESGQYVDCWESGSPYFGDVADFDPDSTPGSTELMTQVTNARTSWRIP